MNGKTFNFFGQFAICSSECQNMQQRNVKADTVYQTHISLANQLFIEVDWTLDCLRDGL